MSELWRELHGHRLGDVVALDADDAVRTFLAARAALSAQELARVRSVNERLGVVREQLARVLALADRQLASVVPQEPAPTYGAGNRPTARIYRAAG